MDEILAKVIKQEDDANTSRDERLKEGHGHNRSMTWQNRADVVNTVRFLMLKS